MGRLCAYQMGGLKGCQLAEILKLKELKLHPGTCRVVDERTHLVAGHFIAADQRLSMSEIHWRTSKQLSQV